ncbi:IclR family transcriptional regulator [Rouxiella sp. T17]|uniref:IclR family transcriptional regulator n=1 Tax=Rouxiella sp. T17 TaxID=3085684 RepID=UPI002FC8B86A
MSDVVRSAARALDLLEFFSNQSHSVSLASVAARFELPKSSALGLLRTLTSRGYLLKDNQGCYYINEAFKQHGFGWGGSALRRLTAVARPAMEEMATQLGETISMGVLTEEGNIKLILQSLSHQPIRYEADLAQILPVHCTAMGRILLSYKSETESQALLKDATLTRYSELTITEPEQVMQRIHEARQQKYCQVIDEYDVGGTGISVAVLDVYENPIAALNVSCVTARFADKKNAILESLFSEAAKLSAYMKLTA